MQPLSTGGMPQQQQQQQASDINSYLPTNTHTQSQQSAPPKGFKTVRIDCLLPKPQSLNPYYLTN
jgi:hypothetical protein